MELRPYQVDSLNLLRNSMKKHKRVVLCLPTGSGKSVIFTELVRLAALKGSRCLILTHRNEIFTSTVRHLERSGIKPGVVLAGKKNPPADAQVIIAMIETLSKRIAKGYDPSPTLIIIDEAHFGNFTKIFQHCPDAFIVGVTATPVGKHFHKHYTDLVANIDIPELVEGGHLMPCIPYQMMDDFSDVKIDSTGEFNNDALYAHFDKPQLYDGVIEQYRDKLIGRKTLVFNVNIAHTVEMNRAFINAGFDSRLITSNTPMDERLEILAAYSRGDFPILNNCGILTTGYDEPSIDAIIMNRATTSLPLWLQCQGRASRPHPGKNDFMVIDFGLNHDRHGLWQEERLWTLDPPKKKKKLDAAPVKSCPKCRFVMALRIMICPECGHEFEIPRKELEINGVPVLQIIKSIRGKNLSMLTISELSHAYDLKLFKYGHILRVVKSRGVPALEQFAKLQGYKRGWVKIQAYEMDESDCTYYDSVVKISRNFTPDLTSDL